MDYLDEDQGRVFEDEDFVEEKFVAGAEAYAAAKAEQDALGYRELTGLEGGTVSAHQDIEHSGEYRRTFGIGGSRSQFIYETECEYQRSLRLAQARQHLPAFGMVPWTDLTVEEQEDAVLVARNWLRAAIAAGLMEDCPIH